jgi:hypothetical protein
MSASASGSYSLARRGLTDAGAPARARGRIDIAAAPEDVFDALADVGNWPDFRPDVTDAFSTGAAAPGQAFSWRAGGALVDSRFALVERPTLLTWSNEAPGMTAACVYRFEPLDAGGTRIDCEESMDASGAALHIDDDALAAGIRSWLAGIRRHIEQTPARHPRG